MTTKLLSHAILTTLLAITTLSAHAEDLTLEQAKADAVHKVEVRFAKRDAKKSIQTRIKAKYKAQIDQIKLQMKAEQASELDKCTTDSDCADKNPTKSF